MELLSVREAAKHSRMSESWWRQRVFRNEIQFVKIGRRVFLQRAIVDEILAKSVVEPKRSWNGGSTNNE